MCTIFDQTHGRIQLLLEKQRQTEPIARGALLSYYLEKRTKINHTHRTFYGSSVEIIALPPARPYALFTLYQQLIKICILYLQDAQPEQRVFDVLYTLYRPQAMDSLAHACTRESARVIRILLAELGITHADYLHDAQRATPLICTTSSRMVKTYVLAIPKD